MKFKRVFVDGYGVFHDFDLSKIASGATVLLGQNESGKTTLLSFIRTMLFGFQNRSKLVYPYEPLSGGRHGGRLTLLDDNEKEFIIERYAGPKGGQLQVTLPDGSAGTADDLAKLVGHTSRDLYRNVFAFSLSELQEFDSLNSEDVRTRIYGAGMGAGSLGLPEIEAKLEKERDDLYVERGSKQAIAKLIRDAADLDGELRTLKQQAGDYQRFQTELADLDSKSKAIGEERRLTRSARDHVANLLRAWDAWTDLNSAQRKLDGLIEVGEFPPDGVSRLARLLERRTDRRGDLSDLERSLAEQASDLDQIEVNEALLQERGRIAGLERGLDMYESARSDLPIRRTELKSEQEALADGLRDLGAGWTEEQVKGFDTSLPTHEAVRQFGGKRETAAGTYRDAERDVISETGVREQLETERGRLEADRSSLAEPPVRDRQALNDRRRAARGLRTSVPGQTLRVQEKQHLDERRDALEEQKRRTEDRAAPGQADLRLWPVVVLVLAALVGGLVLGVLVNVVAGVAVGAALLFAALIYYASVRRSADASTAARAPQAELVEAQGEIDELERKAFAIQTDIDNARRHISGLAAAAGLDSGVTAQEIEVAESRYESDLETLNTWSVADERLTEATRKFDDTDRRLQDLSEAMQAAGEERQRLAVEWQAWLDGRGLDGTLSPETCLEVLSRAKGLREKTKAIDGLQGRIEEMTKATEDLTARTNAVRRLVGIDEVPADSIPTAVDELAKMANEERSKSDHRKQLREQVKEDEGKRNSLKERLDSIELEANALLAKGDAKDEDEFRHRAEISDQRETLQSEVSDRRREIERLFGSEQVEEVLAELGEANPEELTAREGALDERLQDLDRDLESTIDQHGRIVQQISQIEGDERSADLRMQRAVIHEQANGHARRWSVLAIAEALLTETRLKYERDRQPAVIQQAQQFFSSITDGAYQRILSLPGEQAIAVEDNSGIRKDTSQLSRGTAEQLYLSLRFGFIREFAAKAMPLPVIMDDILVNFDPERAAAACRALLELSTDQQVLLFTCHPATVEMMRSASSECSVIELPS